LHSVTSGALVLLKSKAPLLANDARNGAPGVFPYWEHRTRPCKRRKDGAPAVWQRRPDPSVLRSVYPECRLGTTSRAVVSFEKREGRYRSAERVEAHLQVNLVSRYFFRPEIADDGQWMKGVRNVEPSLRRRSRPS